MYDVSSLLAVDREATRIFFEEVCNTAERHREMYVLSAPSESCRGDRVILWVTCLFCPVWTEAAEEHVWKTFDGVDCGLPSKVAVQDLGHN